MNDSYLAGRRHAGLLRDHTPLGRFMNLYSLLALLLLTHLFVPIARADDMPFESLSPDLQKVLQSTKSMWPDLPPEKRKQYIKGGQRWLDSSPEQQQMSQQRFKRWKSMSSTQQQSMRNNFQTFRRRSGSTVNGVSAQPPSIEKASSSRTQNSSLDNQRSMEDTAQQPGAEKRKKRRNVRRRQ